MSPSVAWVVLALYLTASVAVSAGERLRSEYFPERHLSLQGRWQVPSITGDSEVDSRMTATVRNVTLRLFIPPAFTTPPKPVRIYLNLPASVVPSVRLFPVHFPRQKYLHRRLPCRFSPNPDVPDNK